MCSVDAPDPVEIEKPTFVRNPFLDEDTNDVRSATALRRGRSSLVIPTGTGVGFDGRGGSTSASGTGNPNGNSRPANTQPGTAPSGSTSFGGGSTGTSGGARTGLRIN